MALGVPYEVCGGNAGTGSATLTVTVTHTTGLGDCIAVWVTVAANGTITSVTDSQSNTYVPVTPVTNSNSQAGQWWYSLNSAVLTASTDTITLTCGASNFSKTLTAYGCSGVAKNTALDQSPAGTSGTGTTASIAGTALAVPSELCLAGLVASGAAGVATWGGSFTSPVVSDSQHPSGAGYGESAGITVSTGSALTATAAITSASWGMSLVTFRAQQTYVGATIGNNVYTSANSNWPGANLNQAQSDAQYNTYVSRPMATALQKIFWASGNVGTWPSSLTADELAIVNGGAQTLVTFKPNQTYTAAEAGNLANAIGLWKTAYVNAGMPAASFKVCLWQEPNNQDFGTTMPAAGNAFITFWRNYFGNAAVKAAMQGLARVFVPLCGSGSNIQQPTAFYPGDAWCDEIDCDFYGSAYSAGVRLDAAYSGDSHPGGMQAICDAHSPAPIPLGIGEWNAVAGASTATISTATWNNYVSYLVGLFGPGSGRLGQGKANGYVIFWMGNHSIGTSPRDLQQQIISSSDFKIPAGSNAGGQGIQTLFDALQPGKSATAAITGTFSLFANGQNTSGNVKFAGATVRTAFTVSATGTTAAKPAAQIAFAFTLATSSRQASFVVQQVNGTSTFDYGASSVEITTTAGNTLVVLAGWDLSTTGTGAPMPAVNVCDSAGNYWYHVATSPGSVTGSRSSAWICPNARSINWLSCSLTTFASSLAYVVLELAGMPALYNLDVVDTAGAQSAVSLTLNPGTATDADFAFSVCTLGSLSQPSFPAGWTPLTSATASGGGGGGAGPGPTGQPGFIVTGAGPVVNPVSVFPFVQSAAPGTNLGTTYAVGGPFAVSGVTFAVTTTVYPPVQKNPNFPVLKVEAGFGATPGDVSQAPPADQGPGLSWTDITYRAMSSEGDAFITTQAGRQYELSQAEAGTATIALNNQDGAFTPGNTASPFWPNVVLETPVRVSAFWAGTWYAIFYGYVERWPQEWPELPQWGMSRMVATDAISVMASANMLSALDSDLLIDQPAVLIPCSEQYLSFSNGLNSFSGGSGLSALGYYSQADAQGLLAQNYSRVNKRNGMYVDGTGGVIAGTGQTTNLLGSSNTGFGTTDIGAAPVAPASGPGMVYYDQNMPDPVTGNGVTVTFWVIVGTQAVSAAVQPTVFTAYGPPSSYRTSPSLSVQLLNFTGGSTLQITLADGSTVSAPFNGSASAQQITLILTASSLNVYINGAQQATTSLTAAQTTAWFAVSLGCPNYAYGNSALVAGNFTAFDLALYPAPVTAQRAVSWYATGGFGQQNVDAVTRMGQILAWAGLPLPRGGRQTFNGASAPVMEGPAYSLGGATASAAVNQLAVNENSMVAAMPGGAVVFFHQQELFNQSPAAVFGDDPDPTAGQVPYLQGQTWGFDNTQLYTQSQATLQYGPNNLLTATATDFTSVEDYFTRSALQQTITTMSQQDAASLTAWQSAKYAQPSLRVAGVTVDAVPNAAAAFPVILPMQQGQVATVIRTPVGGAQITQNCLVQKLAHNIGPSGWKWSAQMSPYTFEASVLQLDNSGFDQIGNSALG